MRLSILLLTLLSVVTGCSDFDAPPRPALLGLQDGLLPDPVAPLQLHFDEPIDFKTLKLRVIRFEADPEGNLLPDRELRDKGAVLYDLDGNTFDESGGLINDPGQTNQFFTITLLNTLPVGPQLAVVIEPGLTNAEGNNVWDVQQVLKFGFEFSCDEGGEAVDVPEKLVYFLLADVELPIQTQLQLLVDIRTDPTTGDWVGQFTNADRDTTIDCGQFGLNCAAEEVCRTLPTPTCVAPSERAAAVNEHPDFVPNNVLPTGYSFAGVGCKRQTPEGAIVLANAPADVEVQSPQITVKGIEFNLEVTRNADGLLQGGGTFTGQEVFLGSTPSGAGSGTATMIEIPEDQLKDGIPEPPVGPGEPLP